MSDFKSWDREGMVLGKGQQLAGGGQPWGYLELPSWIRTLDFLSVLANPWTKQGLNV